MLIPIGFFGGGAAGAYELISTAYGTGSSSTVTFSSISTTTYKHLQLRIVLGSTLTYEQGSSAEIRFNSDTTANKSFHQMAGNGSGVNASASVNQNAIYFSYLSVPNNPITVAVVDITDAFSTQKNKTIRLFNGYAWTSKNVSMRSSLFQSTAAISSISVIEQNANAWSNRTRFSLYGIKG